MSQKNLEILGDEWIAPSLVESEYPGLIFAEDSIASVDFSSQEDIIFAEDSIASVDFSSQEDIIFAEDSIASVDFSSQEDIIFAEDSIASVDSIAPPGIDVDPLTGMVNKPMVNARTNINRSITLKNTGLKVHPANWDQTRNSVVVATVKVELDPFLKLLVDYGFIDLTLQSTLWGVDGGWNKNDHLFNFPNYRITKEGSYTIWKEVSTSALNEDSSWFDNRDEIQATIKVTGSYRGLSVNKETWTPIKTGYFY
jgi:hypothetical protein